MMETLHFIRPLWLLALLPLLALGLWSLRTRGNGQSWKQVVDPQLLPHLLIQPHGKARHWQHGLWFAGAALAIIAAAGPAWEKLPQPVFRDQSALVIALDLSASMNATDIKPSRLVRARLKLLDILQQRNTGQTALLVYANDAFTVTPLTDDTDTIANLVPTLSPELMPAQGSNALAAVRQAVKLLQQAGIAEGHILLIADGIDEGNIEAMTQALDGRHRLSILGVGSRDGSPIPLADSKTGGFVTDRSGAIVIARMNEVALKRAAAAGGGRYQSIRNDDRDVRQLLALIDADIDMQQGDTTLLADRWREQGPWLLLLVIPLTALYARNGWLLTLLMSCGILNMISPGNALAQEAGNWWFTPDQQAMRAFEQGDHQRAANTFQDPAWKATALYKQGKYNEAAKLLQQSQQADNSEEMPARLNRSDWLYNQGNALAKSGDLQAAMQAYQQALELDPDNDDARYNKKLVEEALKQQQQNQQAQQGQQDQQDQQDASQQNDASSGDNAQNSQQDSAQQNAQEQSEQNRDAQSASQQGTAQTDNAQSPQDYAEQNDDTQSEQQSAKHITEQPSQQSPAQYDKEQNPNDEDTQNMAQSNELTENGEQARQASQLTQRWLQRIPDDPGGLLRRKFLYQYKQRERRGDAAQPW